MAIYANRDGEFSVHVENILYKEISIPETKEKDLSLFDRTDKSFMIIYLFIFIFGIILTVLSI